MGSHIVYSCIDITLHYSRERPVTHCTGGCVGPTAGLERKKYLVPTGIRSRTVQPVAHSLYRLSYPFNSHYANKIHVQMLGLQGQPLISSAAADMSNC